MRNQKGFGLLDFLIILTIIAAIASVAVILARGRKRSRAEEFKNTFGVSLESYESNDYTRNWLSPAQKHILNPAVSARIVRFCELPDEDMHTFLAAQQKRDDLLSRPATTDPGQAAERLEELAGINEAIAQDQRRIAQSVQFCEHTREVAGWFGLPLSQVPDGSPGAPR